jgi:hypothetical protein
MSNENKGISFLKEFKDFIVFLQSLWGILAGISVFFPLSNVLVGLIPLAYADEEAGLLSYFSPELVTAITTLITLFIILWTFGSREKLKTGTGYSVRGHPFLCFIVGLVVIIIYLVLAFGRYELLYEPWYQAFGDSPYIEIISDVIVLVTYSVFFAMITRAFMLLGMREYFRHKE